MPMMNLETEISIRLARAVDLDAVRALLVETWHDTYDALLGAEQVTAITDEWHSLANLRRQLTMTETSFLVAEAAGRIAGHLFANAQQLPILLFSRLYVLPAYQRRGIGGRLMTAATERHPGAGLIRLEVEAGNPNGLAFYRRQGFHPVGEILEAGIRHVSMEKRLGLD